MKLKRLHTLLPLGLLFIALWCQADTGIPSCRPAALPVASDTVQNYGIYGTFGYAQTHSDSLTLSFSAGLRTSSVSPDERLTFTPVLTGTDGQHRAELPPLVVNGRRRTAYYRREQVLDYQSRRPLPYAVVNLPTNEARHTDSITVHFRYRLPFASWMGSASLRLMSTGRECCGDYPLADVLLCTDLQQHAPVRTDTLYLYLNALQPEAPEREPEQPSHLLVQEEFRPAVISSGGHSVTFRLWFRQGERHVVRELYGNGAQIDRMRSTLQALAHRLRTVQIISCSSPEGTYVQNEELTRNRGKAVMHYLLGALPTLSPRQVVTTERPENWEGLEWLLTNGDQEYRDAALAIVRTVPVLQYRETRLMELNQGNPYREMSRELFPLLRYADVIFTYEEHKADEKTEVKPTATEAREP